MARRGSTTSGISTSAAALNRRSRRQSLLRWRRKSTHRKWLHGWLTIDGKQRFFLLDREVPFKRGDDTAYLDLVLRRVPSTGDPDEYGIAPIELKRARRSKSDLASGDADDGGTTISDVAKDIVKLVEFSALWRDPRLNERDCPYVQNKRNEHVHPKVLVWGVHDAAKPDLLDALPTRFLNKAFEKAGREMTRLGTEWFPTSWEPNGENPPRNADKWMWIAYAEIKL